MKYKSKLITESSVLYNLIDFDQNALDGIDLSTLSVCSNRVISWKCNNAHSFKESIRNVNRRTYKCLYCAGRSIWPGYNDLQTLYPDIAVEFDIKKNGITPDRISPKDTTVYCWTCKEDHPTFEQSVEHRVNRRTVCPYCSGRKPVIGKNDLKTLFPEIAKEWDMKRNQGVSPEEVNPFTYVAYYWICPKSHSYKKKVIERTRFHKPVDCPKCIKTSSTSFPEQAIFYYAKKCFPDAINRYKDAFENGMELDVYIPSLKIGIEYDGQAFHNSDSQRERERRKYLACKELGIRLIRIREGDVTWCENADAAYFVSKRMNDEKLSVFIYMLFNRIFQFFRPKINAHDEADRLLIRHYGFPTDFNVSRDRPEIMEYLIDVEHSFGTLYPEIASLWSNEANGKLTPFMFTPGSNYEAVWQCPLCPTKWKSPISSVVARRVKSCKSCSMKMMGEKNTRNNIKKHGSLAERCPKLLKQWDYEANEGLSPYNIPLNYRFKVGWRCDVCDYTWQISPNSRISGGELAGCPHCAGRVAMPGVDDFETLYPELAKEWDYDLNGDVLPSQIKPFANKKFYWHCFKCGNSYKTYPGNRIKGHGCPNCARETIGRKNSKPVGQFDKNGMLIRTYYGLHEAARAMGVVPNSIFQAVKGGGKSKGYYWRYVPDDSG